MTDMPPAHELRVLLEDSVAELMRDEINTNAPDLVPQQVEQLVTFMLHHSREVLDSKLAEVLRRYGRLN